MRASAPLLNDQPASEDLLDYATYCRVLREIVTSPSTSTPLILGIFGRWGTGKTTLMRMMERELRGDGVTTVWFNAWLYNQEEETWAAFLQSLLTKLDAEVGLERRLRVAASVFWSGLEWRRLVRELPRLAALAVVAVAPLVAAGVLSGRGARPGGPVSLAHAGAWLVSAVLGGVLLLKPAFDAVRDRVKLDFAFYRSSDFEHHVAFLDRFRDHFERVVCALPEVNGKRLVVFVDDLDRCDAPRTLQILDALKVFLDVPGCVFVLGLDADVVQRAVATKYPGDAATQAEYLAKIVQVPFHLPPLTRDVVEGYLRRLLATMPDERCRDVFVGGLSMNPREIKRVVNVFSLLWHLGSDARGELQGVLTPVRLAKVVVLQHAFPELHAVLRQEPGLLAELERHFRRTRGQGADAPQTEALTAVFSAASVRAGERPAPAALEAFVHNRALERLLLLHDLEDGAADDANFARLGRDEISSYYTLTRRVAAPSAHVDSGPDTERHSFGDAYDVVRQLGRGGSGVVYLAVDRRTGREVAVKTLHAALAENPDWQRRFEREMDVLTRVAGHPNVVAILDRGTEITARGTPAAYFAMELVGGRSLQRALVERGRLSPNEVVGVFGALCDALAHVHRRGVLHRDVKPDAVLLDDRGVPKLTDFGIARAISEPDDDASAGSERVTADGMLVGTPAYMSPERLGGSAPVDERSDLFSLGIALYESLTGAHPFAADGDRGRVDVVPRIFGGVYAPPSATPGVPAAFDAVVARLLARAPADRFASAEEAAHALRSMRVGDGTATARGAAGPAAPLPPKLDDRWPPAIAAPATTVDGREAGEQWRTVLDAVGGEYELVSEIGSADGCTAFLGREAQGGALRALLLAEDDGATSVASVRALGPTVPAPATLTCAACGAGGAGVHWWRRCAECGAEAVPATHAAPSVIAGVAAAHLGPGVELLGAMPHVSGGRVYFGRDRATRCVSALEIVAGEADDWCVRRFPLPCPPSPPAWHDAPAAHGENGSGPHRAVDARRA